MLSFNKASMYGRWGRSSWVGRRNVEEIGDPSTASSSVWARDWISGLRTRLRIQEWRIEAVVSVPARDTVSH